MLLQADGDRCTVVMVLDWTGVGWAGLDWGCTYASVKHGQQAACMSVSVLPMSMTVCVVGCCAHASTDEDEVGR